MIYVIGFIAVACGVAIDQLTKFLAITHLKNQDSFTIIKGVFELEYLENEGAAWGLFQGQQTFFLIVSVVSLIALTYIYIRMPRTRRFVPFRICLLSITAGAIGNMIDRIRFKYVVDFFDFELINFPIFNVADIFASVATVVLMVLFLFYYKDKDIDELFSSLSFKRKRKEEQ